MRAITTFSGIEGGGLGLERAGFEIAAQVEIDPFCQRVLARRYPNVPKFPDVTTFDPRPLGPVDLVCGGSPCQDLSVAGKRAGLAGERSGLFYELVRILDESAADWLLFENVPGLLSSHGGADFAIVLRELTGFEPAVPSGGWRKGGLCVGPDRAVAWRVLDAQYFGLAQRRQRLFLVANPRVERAVAVLFEPESGAGDPAPRDEEAAIAAGALARSIGSVGGGDDVGANKGTLIVAPRVSRPLMAEGYHASEDGGRLTTKIIEYAPDEYAPDVSAPLRAEGHDASEDGTGRQPAHIVEIVTQPVASALMGSGGPGASTSGRMMDEDVNLVATFRKSARARSSPETGGYETWVPTDVSNTIKLFDDGDVRATELIVHRTSRVRRLTITERERLQGFPDGWTCLCGVDPYSSATCRCPDGPRARALGNAMPVDVIAWIAGRVAAVAS